MNDFGQRRPMFAPPPARGPATRNPLLQSSEAFNELKFRLHQRLIEELEQVVDLRAVAEADAEPGDDVDADTFFDALYRERSWRTAS